MEVFIFEFIFPSFKGSFMFSFLVEPDLDKLFEKSIAEIGARSSLETQLRFETPGELRTNIFRIQRLIWPKFVDSQPAAQKRGDDVCVS